MDQNTYDRGFRCGDQAVSESYLGSCLCARVRYKLLTSPKAVTHCHCKQCQKSHGAAFATYGAVPHKDLCIVTGDDAIKSYASSESVFRQFCQHCGSSLFWSKKVGDWDDWICIALGTLDSPFTALKQKHVHQDSQPSWSPCTPG
ncbi:GFA family protein [Stutzerimonas nitrititolerans]|uniref:GFA family protein n=1 Tax=Stutzerimonas nitrititolerans TaxID=2482751 RepID=UPI0028B1DD72|nr:GFA family protein [Stutzerimonas nitrititolerans]